MKKSCQRTAYDLPYIFLYTYFSTFGGLKPVKRMNPNNLVVPGTTYNEHSSIDTTDYFFYFSSASCFWGHQVI